jgi:hypothetical protein
MGFIQSLGETVAKKLVVDRAFEAGRSGDPPPSYSDSEAGRSMQRLSDEAYEKGQRSVLVKIGNKLAD